MYRVLYNKSESIAIGNKLTKNNHSKENMAVSATMMIQMKHRQLLYAVSTRLSRENLKDMMYLAVIDKELQQSVQSGTDFFTILEHNGLLSHQNYTHLISMLETIGRIDLIETIFSGHQTKAAMFTPSASPFSVPEQLVYMKRAQILRKRERYLQCMQKLDGLVKYNTIYQQEYQRLLLQFLSELQISEIDLNDLPVQSFAPKKVCKMLSSISSCCKCFAEGTVEVCQTGDTRSWDYFQTQFNQSCKEFCAELPTDEKQLRLQLNTNAHERETMFGVITKDAYQSLHDVFIELFGQEYRLVVADASLNNAMLELESLSNIQYIILMFKWLLILLLAIENGLVNIEDIKDVVMAIASIHWEGIVEAAEGIAKIIGQDSLEELLHLIPISKKSSTESVKPGRSSIYLTCLTLLVLATLPNRQENKQLQLKFVLPELRKVVVCKMNTKLKNFKNYTCIMKLIITNIHKKTQLYKKECEQVLLKLTRGSQKSADNFRLLFNLQS